MTNRTLFKKIVNIKVKKDVFKSTAILTFWMTNEHTSTDNIKGKTKAAFLLSAIDIEESKKIINKLSSLEKEILTKELAILAPFSEEIAEEILDEFIEKMNADDKEIQLLLNQFLQNEPLLGTIISLKDIRNQNLRQAHRKKHKRKRNKHSHY